MGTVTITTSRYVQDTETFPSKFSVGDVVMVQASFKSKVCGGTILDDYEGTIIDVKAKKDSAGVHIRYTVKGNRYGTIKQFPAKRLKLITAAAAAAPAAEAPASEPAA